MYHPVISNVEGLEISPDEAALFKEFKPLGFILFKRNCDTKEQVKALTDQMKECVGNNDIPILIDQEGGRVARLQPPIWKKYPSGQVFSKLYDLDQKLAISAVNAHARLIAFDLCELGINVDCYPAIDILFDGANDIIGDRSFGKTTDKIVELGRAAAEGLISGGITPMMKHIPGHGRASVDSHEELPIVDTTLKELRKTDFVPFRELNYLPCAMTAHVIYSQIDDKRCATISKKVIKKIIRGEMEFRGVLFSDDLGMKALKDTAAQNALDALKAGCNVALHCNGTFDEKREVLEATKNLQLNEDNWILDILRKPTITHEVDHDELYDWLIDTIKNHL